jgi:hypothetical protein
MGRRRALRCSSRRRLPAASIPGIAVAAVKKCAGKQASAAARRAVAAPLGRAVNDRDGDRCHVAGQASWIISARLGMHVHAVRDWARRVSERPICVDAVVIARRASVRRPGPNDRCGSPANNGTFACVIARVSAAWPNEIRFAPQHFFRKAAALYGDPLFLGRWRRPTYDS